MSKPLDKNKIEEICRNGGLKPVHRASVEGAEVFIADGFSMPPHHKYRHFGIGPLQFPYGMYVTLWWVSRQEDKLEIGAPFFCEIFHDPSYSPEDKQKLRINAAMKEARDLLRTRKRVKGMVH